MKKNEEIFANPTGSDMRKHGVPRRDIDGNYYLEELDEINQYKMIQSYKEQTDIRNIIAAYGGISNIPQIDNIGGSNERIPRTTREMAELRNKVQEGWKKLDTIQKNYFGTYENYVKTLSDNEGLEKYIKAFTRNAEKTMKKTENNKGVENNVEK